MSSVKFGLPSTEILYDKIIDVELVGTETNKDVACVIGMNGSMISGDVVSKRKAVYQAQYGAGNKYWQGIYTSEEVAANADAFGNITMPSNIVIYKGFEHKEYWIDAKGNTQSKTVTATGRTITLDPQNHMQGHRNTYKKGYGTNAWWLDENFHYELNKQLNEITEERRKYYADDPSTRAQKIEYHPANQKYDKGPFTFPLPTYQIEGSELVVNNVQDGVRIIVNNNGKQERYHAVYVKTDESQTVTEHVSNSFKITCDKGGIKPSIVFSTNVIPGNNCYKMTLKIFNMNMNYDIRKIKTIKVTAGYRTQGFQTTFTCPVFSSYIESPNPDGVTVFECLCVGQCDSFASSSPVNFHYLGGKITLADFIAETARGLSKEKITIHNYLKDEYKALKIHMTGRMDTYFENGAATLTWMRNIIQKRIAAAEGFVDKPQEGSSHSYPYIMCTLGQEGDLYIYALNRENSDTGGEKDGALLKDVTNVSTTPVLDAIKGASFNGVALSVKAAWNPRIRPGELFSMEANIYNGANLPNTLNPIQYGKDDNNGHLYRCVTCSIVFSTNGNENEMNILAVPLVYMEDSAYKDLAFVDTFDSFITTALSTYDTRSGEDVYYGKADESDTEATNEQQIIADADASRNKMYQQDLSTIFTETMVKTSGYKIESGNTLSQIAAAYFDRAGAPDGNKYCDFDIIPDNPGDLPQGVYTGAPLMVNSRACLWPIIAVLTYNYWKRDNKVTGKNNKWENMVGMTNPDMIHIGKYLVIPVIQNFAQLQKCKEVFKYAYYAWPSDAAFPQYAGWRNVWYKLYQYLGGTF